MRLRATSMALVAASAVAASAVVVPPAPGITVRQISSDIRTGDDPTGSAVLGPVAAGSWLLLDISAYDSQISSVVGSVNGAFTRIHTTVSGNDNRLEVWAKRGTVEAPDGEIITVTPANPGNGYMAGAAIEVVGIDRLDLVTQVIGAPTATQTRANSKANSLVMTAIVRNSGGMDNFQTPEGFTLIDRSNDADSYTGHQSAYRITTALETSSATVTGITDRPVVYDSYILTFDKS